MARPVTLLVIFFLAFNLFSGMLLQTGVASMLGIDANVGEDEETQEKLAGGKNVSAGTGEGDDLFGLYNTLSRGVNDLFDTVFPGLRMLNRAGVPDFITNGFLGPLFSLFISIAIVSFLRGTDL
jgi:hypothetical protein